MPFSYHPPTRTRCDVCLQLHSFDRNAPIIDSFNGKASSADNYPFHNWYNFVLGYSPEFPKYMLQRESITTSDLVIDPFMGSGTTLVACKMLRVPSMGLDANDFMVDAARVKLDWDLDAKGLKRCRDQVLERSEALFGKYAWYAEDGECQLTLFVSHASDGGKLDYRAYADERRPKMLDRRYMSDKVLAQVCLIDDAIGATLVDSPLKAVFDMALTSIIVPVSNVRYGPGFGVVSPRDNVDVRGALASKVNRMIRDLESVDAGQRATPARAILGDARHLSEYFEPNSAALMITSPPYPGDHEYTKHTRLELIFRSYASNLEEFRVIKRRMLRGSTTNIYKDDNDREPIQDLASIQLITDSIQERLKTDGATSGFEKLYTKVVWEYFGGMYKSLIESFKILKPGGKIALLVSDSHAFKMVHIQTAQILREIGERIGFVNPEIVLWQLKSSTSHKYSLRENILILSKPF